MLILSYNDITLEGAECLAKGLQVCVDICAGIKSLEHSLKRSFEGINMGAILTMITQG